jgi:hypothetical protein
MCNRISTLHKDVPLTLIYGSRSWVDHSPSDTIKQIRSESYVDIQVSLYLLENLSIWRILGSLVVCNLRHFQTNLA